MKKLFSFLILLAVTTSIFAQSGKSTGLTDNDVKNWAKNYFLIEESFDDAGIDEDNTASLSPKKKALAEAILKKNGISGANCIEKFAMIQQCATILLSESELDEQSKALMKAMGLDPLAELKANINEKDYAVVEANSKLVLKTINKIEEDEKDDYDDMDENPYESYMAELAGFSNNITKKAVQPKIDEINAEAEPIKALYNALQKSRGDCGFIYKKVDAEGASEYKKVNSKVTKLLLGTPEGEVDLKKKTIELDFEWIEASYDKDSDEYIKKTEVEKELNFNIKSYEVYKAGNYDEQEDIRTEYVLVTKEGPIIHLWNSVDYFANSMPCEINFNGKPDAEIDLSWGEIGN